MSALRSSYKLVKGKYCDAKTLCPLNGLRKIARTRIHGCGTVKIVANSSKGHFVYGKAWANLSSIGKQEPVQISQAFVNCKFVKSQTETGGKIIYVPDGLMERVLQSVKNRIEFEVQAHFHCAIIENWTDGTLKQENIQREVKALELTSSCRAKIEQYLQTCSDHGALRSLTSS